MSDGRDKQIPEELRAISAEELQHASAALPDDQFERLIVFIEATRVLDCESVKAQIGPENKGLAAPDLNMIQNGWNQVAANCLTPLSQKGAFPLMESTVPTRSFAVGLLHQFGRAILMQRVADMVQYGILTAKPTSDGFDFTSSEEGRSQWLDEVESIQLIDFENRLARSKAPSYNAWQLLEHDEGSGVEDHPGAFLSRRRDNLDQWLQADVDALMIPLIRPWKTNRGTMMAYDAIPELDDHFLALALSFIIECRDVVGIDPTARLGASTGGDIVAVAMAVASLHMKHVRFAAVASERHKEISIPQSLTIWCPEDQLATDIAEWSGLPRERVTAAMEAITLRAGEAAYLARQTMAQIPLLVSFENNVVLRPVASISRNPLVAMANILIARDPRTRDAFDAPREDLLRNHLYAMFQGRRYLCIEGSIKLRCGSQIVTDIDAAVFDRTSGDLAVFQLKWQDFLTNDVRALRSRASNFAREVDEWADRFMEWIKARSVADLGRTMRITPRKHGPIRRIFLFALSRTAARVQGYGYSSKHEAVAVASWPHFVRVRREVGPVDCVLDRIHEVLAEEASATVEVEPVPVEWTIAGRKMWFKDLYNRLPSDTGRREKNERWSE